MPSDRRSTADRPARAPRPLLALALLAACATPLRAQGVDLFDDSVVRQLRITFDDVDWYDQLVMDWCANGFAFPGATEFVGADIELAGYCFEGVQIRARGQTSFLKGLDNSMQVPCDGGDAGSEATWLPGGPRKFPLEINLPDSKAFGVDTLRLNNAAYDSSLVREVLSMKLMGSLIPAPRGSWMQVLARGPNDSEYVALGLYAQYEHLDRQFMQRIFWQDDGRRYNNGYVPDVPVNGTWICASLEGTYVANPASPDGCSLDDYALWTQAAELLDSGLSGNALWNPLNTFLDVDEQLRYWAVWALLGHLDSAEGEAFEDSWHGTLAFVPQGFDNLAFASPSVTVLDLGANDAFWGDTQVDLLLQTQPFRRRYLAHMRTVAEDLLSDSELIPWIDERTPAIQAACPSPVDPWFALTYEFFGPEQCGLDVYDDIQVVLPLIPGKAASILAHPALADAPPVILDVSPGDQRVVTGSVVTISVEIEDGVGHKATLHWRGHGPWQQVPMFDTGLDPDLVAGDGVYTVELTMPVEASSWVQYYVEAARNSDTEQVAAFSPRKAGFEPYELSVSTGWSGLPVRINELLAANKRTDQNPCTGEDDDWFELHNPGPGTHDVGGWQVTRGDLDGSDPVVWAIPQTPLTVLEPGESLRIWCAEPAGETPKPDGDDGKGPAGPPDTPCKQLVAPFSLARSGGQWLSLRGPGGLADRVRFKRQTRDISYGRWPDGSGDWRPFTNPTGGMPNLESIFDVNQDGAVDYDDLFDWNDDWYGEVCDPCEGCFGDFNHDGVVDDLDLGLLIQAIVG